MLSGYNHDYFSDKIGYFCGLQIELEANDLTCREKLIHIGEVVKKVILAIGLGTTMGRLKLSLSNTFVFYPCKCPHDNTHTSSSASVFCADPSFAVAAPVLKAGHSKKVVAGRRLKLSCKVESLLRKKSEILMLQVTNKVFPWPAISWYKDGALLSSQDPRVTITSKKYVSLMSPSNQKVSFHYKFDFS